PGPEPLSARLIADPRTHDPVIEVRFTNVVGALDSGASLPIGFSVVDRQLRPLDIIFKTVLDGSRARLHLTTMDAVALRLMYGRGSNPSCNLLDARGMAVPVFGPLPIAGFPMMSSWLLGWDVSPIRSGEDVANLPRPTRDTVPGVERHEWSVAGFVNCHDAWSGRSGHVVFFSNVEAAEDMETELCTGYDGPFRLWVDDREVHCDPAGTNPAIADRVRIALRLGKGRHRLTVLMALNRGLAWGFFMRFARPGVEDADIESGKRPLPVACW
ncbi:MAG: sialate O-acetylesterase, partial [Planctomycetes bacterium]|nr:sialate O-acetylesterase [Planctomycetota bacterium]